MFQRTLQQTVEEISSVFPVLLVTGPRQVGKTTLLQMCAGKDTNYVTLDDLEERNLANQDPKLFLETHPTPLIIDEVQYAPELLIYIKINVDARGKSGDYWLTGSQKFHLMQGITESLAGRVGIIDLLGLSQSEIEGKRCLKPFLPNSEWMEAAKKEHKRASLHEIYERIWLGSFPRLHQAKGKARNTFYRSYVQTYVERDVADLLSIQNRNRFYRFLVAVAARTGQLLCYSNIAKEVGIDQKTVTSWLSTLETSGLIYLLRPYYTNLSKRLIRKTPKLYFLDTGLCSYLTKWPDPLTLERGSMSGALFETYIFGELLKSYWHQGKEAPFYFYRDQDQNEVDLLIETADALYPIEIKKSAMPSREASKGFASLSKLGKKIGLGAVISLVDQAFPLTREVYAIPASYL